MSDARDGIAVGALAAWLGAAVLMAASVAPAAFAALPTRTLAGDVVGRVLPVVLLWGVATGLVAMLIAAPASRTRAILGAAVTAACAVAALAVDPRIATLRADFGAGGVDALPAGDARRAAFGRLHLESVGLLALAMVAAFSFLVHLFVSRRQRP